VNYVRGIADILLKGHNADNVSNYDERLLQQQMVSRIPKTPDVIVLGSSRAMEIGSDFFPGKTLLNCAVSHADIHDLIAIAGLMDSAGRMPEQVVINVDPFLVSEGNASEWKSIAAYQAHFLRVAGIGDGGNHQDNPFLISPKYASLVSPDYFQKSLLFFTSGKKKNYRDVGLERPVVYGRFSDGTVCYSEAYTHPDTAKVAGDAAQTAAKTGMAPPDPAKTRLLEQLLDFFQSRHVRVQLIMLPVHEQYYSVVNARQANLFVQNESWFRDLAKNKSVPVSGGFDAKAFGLTPSVFYDMYHCSKAAIKSVINLQ
jgi:hypothetical protein